MVVVHHTHLIPNIVDRLKSNDLVFFDDCLYSQYVFLCENMETLRMRNIVCVLGLSPKVVRPSDAPGMYGIESAILHKQLNSQIKTCVDEITGTYINGFMNISEVKYLLTYDNVFIALHGCCHLKLEDELNRFKQTMLFKQDLVDGLKMFDEYGFQTDIFVYPYAFEPFLGSRILKENGFRYIFAGHNSKRIPVEELK